MFGLQKLAGMMACGLLGWAGTVAADAVTDWNEITMTAVISIAAALFFAVRALAGQARGPRDVVEGAFPERGVRKMLR